MIGKTQASSSLPSPIPQSDGINTGAALNQTSPPDTKPDNDAAPAPEKKKPSALDKYNAVASAVSSSVQKGLSYANARRAREKYNAKEWEL